jgi:hypothetical protein
VQNLVRIGRLRLVDTTNRQAVLHAEDTRDAIPYTVYPSDYYLSILKCLKDLQSTAKSRYGMIYSDDNGRLPPSSFCDNVLRYWSIATSSFTSPPRRSNGSSIAPCIRYPNACRRW